MPGRRRHSQAQRQGTVVNIGKVIETEMRLRRLAVPVRRGERVCCVFGATLDWNLIKLIKYIESARDFC